MKHQRFLLGCILVLLLLFLMLYYNQEYNLHSNPSAHYILSHFEQFNGTKVIMGGVVTDVNQTNHSLRFRASQAPEYYLWLNTSTPLDTTHPEDTIEVYGTLMSKTRMTADTILISPSWAYTLIFIRSLFAIPFVVYLFFRAYRFNPTTRRFERRTHHA